jgi:hypothetical protein
MFAKASMFLFGTVCLIWLAVFYNAIKKDDKVVNENKTPSEANRIGSQTEQVSAPEPFNETNWDDDVANELRSLEFGLTVLEGATRGL